MPYSSLVGGSAITIIAAMIMSSSGLAQPVSGSKLPAPPQSSQAQRPNVLVWLMDDVGFGQLRSFGGLVDTPNIDRVVKLGLRYDNYHTAPICSASRAALLTGRNSHSVNNGGHASSSIPVLGYSGKVPASAGTVAENLRQAGYATFQVGKWDHLPPLFASSSGPFTYWPSGQGFERSYSFLSYDSENFTPTLVRDNTPIPTPSSPNYHISADFADQAIQMINSRDAGPSRPFFLYWATGAAHAPLQAPQEWLDRFRGKFDMGWDRYRALVLKKQISMGIVPPTTKLAPRPSDMPAWDSLSANEKKLFARQMEAFAACLAFADNQFGRILDLLEKRGELEDTLVIIASDNGASAESGPPGLMNEAYVSRQDKPTAEDNLAFYSKWGRPGSYPGYSMGWAVAGNTPYRYYKQTTYEGGIRVPLIVSYPRGIHNAGGALRANFVHVSDIAPTILDITGVKPALIVNNVPQSALEGISFIKSFDSDQVYADRPQYFELYGNKGLIWNNWAITTMHRQKTWDYTEKLPGFDLPWSLFDLRNDPGQTVDLAQKYPARVKQLAAMFDEQARKYHVLPQHDMADSFSSMNAALDRVIEQHHSVWHYFGPVTNISPAAAPPTQHRSFHLTATVDLPRMGVTGPIFASGGSLGGHALYIDHGRPVFVVTDLHGEITKVSGDIELNVGENEIQLDVDKQSSIGTIAPYRVQLQIGGRVVADQTVNLQIPPVYNSDSFDVGADQGSTVLPGYPGGRPLESRALDVLFDFKREAISTK